MLILVLNKTMPMVIQYFTIFSTTLDLILTLRRSAMIDFAKSKGVTNSAALIANAQAFAIHPRNALNINGVTPSTPFCLKAPRNTELNGLSHKQLDGVNPGLFGGPAFDIVAFGNRKYCPLQDFQPM